MLSRLLPARLDNTHSGHKLALWLFGLVVALKGLQSLSIMFNGFSTAIGADGIPLDTFTPAVAQTVLAVLAQGSLWRLIFCLLGVLVLVRYRSAIPLMLAVLVLQYLTGQLIYQIIPLPRAGTPPGPIVNLVMCVLAIVGLILSLWSRHKPAKPAA
jgi:hypothetical protein